MATIDPVRLKLSRTDRVFLHSLHIDPEATPQELLFDEYHRPFSRGSGHFAISVHLAADVIREYGKLNVETLRAYREKYKA